MTSLLDVYIVVSAPFNFLANEKRAPFGFFFLLFFGFGVGRRLTSS